MKKIFFGLLLLFPLLCWGQTATNIPPSIAINKINPFISITAEQLKEVQTLLDINPHYQSSWVRSYHSVELQSFHNGQLKKAIGKNDRLNPQQIDQLRSADLGTEISVIVHYWPENNLSKNDLKKMNFSFVLAPKQDAKFHAGETQLETYLKEKAIDLIPINVFQGYTLAAIKFTVGKTGAIINPHIFWSCEDKKTDESLLAAISHMPHWIPASYEDGTTLAQDFVLTVGSMENCAIPLLNIRPQ